MARSGASPRRGSIPALWLLGPLLLGLSALGVGCSGDSTKPVVAERPTTTDPSLAADLEPEPVPPSADSVVADLQTAVAAGDFCGLLAAIDSARPTEPDDAVAVYRELATATAAAQSFVPSELRVRWQEIVTATETASTAVEERDGDPTDPDVAATLGATAVVEALETIERYQLTSCPAPAAG